MRKLPHAIAALREAMQRNILRIAMAAATAGAAVIAPTQLTAKPLLAQESSQGSEPLMEQQRNVPPSSGLLLVYFRGAWYLFAYSTETTFDPNTEDPGGWVTTDPSYYPGLPTYYYSENDNSLIPYTPNPGPPTTNEGGGPPAHPTEDPTPFNP